MINMPADTVEPMPEDFAIAQTTGTIQPKNRVTFGHKQNIDAATECLAL